MAEIVSRDNLEKIMRMYLYPLFVEMSPKAASDYLDLIDRINAEPTQQNIMTAESKLRDRFEEGSFETHLQEYLNRVSSIEEYIRSNRILKGWKTFNATYER